MSTAELQRLGHHVVARRVQLGYRTRVALANDLPLTDRTLANIENGDRRASAGTYGLLETILQWEPGSIAAVLEGGDPTEVAARPRTASPRRHLDHIPTADLVEQIRSLFSELRRRLPVPNDSEFDSWGRGLDPGGDWPQDHEKRNHFGK